MKDQDKTKDELINELMDMRHKNAEFEASLAILRQREVAAQEAVATSKAMIEAFDGFIYVCSPNYEVEFMNERFIQRTGYNPTGEKCYQALHDRDEICPWCVNERVQLGETVRWEVQSPKDNLWYYVVNTPVRHRDGTISKMAVIQDITERKQAEEVLKEAKDDLELRVQERTSELESSVQRLEKEISVRKETEAALRESEQRFRAIFENHHVVMLIIEPETGSIEDASPGACAFYGYEREELKKKKMTEINTLPPEELFKKVQAATYRQRRYFDFQHRLASGEIRDVEVCTGPIMIGGRTFLFSVITDATDRKRAEKGLRESEERYREAYEKTPVMMQSIDRDGRLVSVSDYWLEVLGYERSEVIGRHPADFQTQESRRYALEIAIPDFLGTGVSKNEPLQFVKKNGEVIEVLLTATAERDDKGEIVRSRAVLIDVTERNRAQEALSQAKHDWEDTFNSINDMITVHDKDFNIIRYNKAGERMLGLQDSLIPKGLKCYKYYHGKNSPPGECPSCRCLETGEQATFEIFEPHLNRHIEISAIPRFDNNGQLTGLIHVVRDISDRKRAEEEKASLELQLLQSQKMEAIGTLSGGIAHDFNNLLTVILGYSELIIAEKDKKDRDYEDLKKVIHAARSAADMVQQILAFSRKTETKLRPLNLNRQVEQLRKMLSRLIPRTIEVHINLDPDLPTVNADQAQIDQILMNLAVNARDSMPDGGRLTIETRLIFLDDEYCRSHVEASGGAHALLTVSDTGIGIDKASMDRIFEPFYTTKKPGEGTGLGLAMVYGIVKSHGGHVTCYSDLGVGTTFNIYLPVHQVESEVDVETSQTLSAFGTGTILLVDDEEFVRDLGKRLLEKAGYNVITASDGREAFEIYKEKGSEISLVILDLIMPVMDGNQCLDEILRIDPGAKVLIATGYSPHGATEESSTGKAKGFVGKPYRVKELLKTVRDVLTEK